MPRTSLPPFRSSLGSNSSRRRRPSRSRSSIQRNTRLMTKMLTALALGTTLLAQAPAFDVATIKQNKSGEQLAGIQRQPGGRVTITNMSLRTLVTYAYRINGNQLAGGPGWTDIDRFDIVAKMDGPPEMIVP